MDPKFIRSETDNYYPDEKFKAPVAAHESIVSPRSWDEYKDRHKPTFDLSRTDNGVVTAKWWTLGEEMKYGVGAHRGWGQLLTDISQDPDAECLIIGPSGDNYLRQMFPNMVDERKNMPWWSYEHMYIDGTTYMEALINLRIPTIGVIIGTAPHAELAMMCDITLMSEEAVILDPHFKVGGIPGDGIQLCLQHVLGTKRANHAMVTGEAFPAQKALELGMVSEVVPKDKIWDRAMEIAQNEYMTKDRIARRLMSEICKDPWRETLAKYLRPNFGREMWSFFTNAGLDHKEAGKDFDKMNEEREKQK